MARRRFLVDQIRNGAAELRGDEARHLARVLRAEPGQQYEISDSRAVWLAEITEARGDRVVFRVLEPVAAPEIPVRITLLAALIKFERFEWMIEKATELGVERIVPFAAARSEKGLLEASRKRAGRWARIAQQASQQSRRLRAPEVLPALRLDTVFSEAADFRYILEEAGAPSLLSCLPALRGASSRVALLLGPEGGWTDSERLTATQTQWLPVSLGPLVLRAETAAAAALAIVLNAWYGGTVQLE
ncbi:MAG TPA: RsmE family RNA methyltransferase [Bryobacteraceae bacterium]|nr:RsmE family RNA methyltransferase [Bryobacteraceae bacterium]